MATTRTPQKRERNENGKTRLSHLGVDEKERSGARKTEFRGSEIPGPGKVVRGSFPEASGKGAQIS